MRHPPQAAAFILEKARDVLQSDTPDDRKLYRLWTMLAYLQAHALANGLHHIIGDKVYSGPFKGMQLELDAMVGAYAPHLLGCYEHELHPAFEQVIARGYENILNIGCSFGYYAIGLARCMPGAKIYAFDIDAEARRKCEKLAELNGVQDRITIAGEFRGEDFAGYPPEDTFALVDIEGAEKDLLDPVRYPALQKIDLIVEMHDVFDPNISALIGQRFAPTHDIDILPNRACMFDLESILGKGVYIEPFDQMLVSWENREGPTPWAILKAKK